MIDTFSCIPFHLPHLIFKVILFPLKSLYSSLKNSTLPATVVRFFTLTSNLHKVMPFFDITAVKSASLDDVGT